MGDLEHEFFWAKSNSFWQQALLLISQLPLLQPKLSHANVSFSWQHYACHGTRLVSVALVLPLLPLHPQPPQPPQAHQEIPRVPDPEPEPHPQPPRQALQAKVTLPSVCVPVQAQMVGVQGPVAVSLKQWLFVSSLPHAKQHGRCTVSSEGNPRGLQHRVVVLLVCWPLFSSPEHAGHPERCVAPKVESASESSRCDLEPVPWMIC